MGKKKLFAMLVALGAGWSVAAAAADQPVVMKMSLATINDAQHQWVKDFVAAVEKDSGGRIKGEIYPASQLGSIPRQIEGVQFGAIQCWVGPPEFLVGVDERFELMSVPGIFTSRDQANHIIADPEIKDMILGWGADKGLAGTGLFLYGESSVITRKPVRHLADFKGLKLRVLAAKFQQEMVNRLGAAPVAMTLGDVLPALQQGAIDGSVSAMPVFTTFRYVDTAKYVTDITQPYIFSVAEFSKKWLAGLPKDLQKIIMDDGAARIEGDRAVVLGFLRQAGEGVDGGRRRAHQPAARRAEGDDGEVRQHRRRRVEVASRPQRRVQDANRGGRPGEIAEV